MRLLVIGINYAPEQAGIAPYTTALSEHLASMGHEVHALAGMPHYPAWRRDGRELLPENRDLVNGVHLHRRSHYVPRTQSVPGRAWYEFSFVLTGSSLVALRRPDAIVGVIPALGDGVLARLASLRFRAPYGLIFQDLMGQAAKQSGMAGGNSVAKLTRMTEGWVARGAKRVAIVSDGFAGYLEGLGVPGSRITRVRNWAYAAEKPIDRSTVRRRLGWPEDAFVCLHAGNMGYKQGLNSVIAAAELAGADEALLFALLGDGSQRADLIQAATSRNVSNVWFGGTLANEDYAGALASADLLLLNQSVGVRDMSFPSKLGSYVSSGTPVVAAVERDSEVGSTLLQTGAGLVIEPGNPRALLNAVRQVDGDESLRQKLSNAGRELALNQYSQRRALAELEEFVESIASRNPEHGQIRPLRRAGTPTGVTPTGVK